MNNVLRFWNTCEHGACRRASACCGEAESCFITSWHKLPEFKQVWYRQATRSLYDGRDRAQAQAEANAAVERWYQDKLQDLREQQSKDAARQQAGDNATSSAPCAMPRIRTL